MGSPGQRCSSFAVQQREVVRRSAENLIFQLMMETSAIIGISVAAGVVFLASLMILVYCLCLKSRHSDKEKKAQRHSTGSNFISAEGMPSTLPKVGSNGLWIPSQSMLSASPSSAYTQAKPHGKAERDILYRATSEPRILEGQDHGRGYQGNLRIYHSQQLAPLYEVYQPGRYDRYLGVSRNSDPLWEDSRMYHSQAMLIENGYQMNNVYEKQAEESRLKIRRSSSDVTASSSQRFRGQRVRPTDERGIPYADKKFTAVVEVHQHRQLPVRSHWGLNRGPNKERHGAPRGKPTVDNDDHVQDNTLTRQSQLPVGQYPGSSMTWDSAVGHPNRDSTPTTTIYSPESGESYQSDARARYTEPTEENFKLELRTSYSSSHSSKPASVDQGVQVGLEPEDMPVADNTVASKHIRVEMDEDGGYFTSSGRTEERFKTPKPLPDHDVVSDATDLANKGKHVTAEAFQFLDTYLSDDEQSTAVG